jgi:hypothetical protein
MQFLNILKNKAKKCGKKLRELSLEAITDLKRNSE